MKEEKTYGSSIEKSKTLSIVFVLFFMMALIVPMFLFFFSKKAVKAPDELRIISSKPNLVWDSITTFPKRYDSYFNDNFPLRSTLIKMNSYYEVGVFGISPQPDKVIVGKNNWLFYAPCISDTFQMQDFAGEIPYSKNTLQLIRKNILEEKKYFDGHHIRFVLVIVPNKQDVYPEYLPDVFNEHKGVSRLDQIYSEVKDLNYFIDLREALKKAKNKYGDRELYYKADSHWNQLGAIIGWKEIWKKIVPEEADLNFNFHFSEDTITSKDLAHLIAIPDAYDDDYVYPINFTLKQKFHKALVYHDSFYRMMEPYFNNCFDLTTQVEHSEGIKKVRIEKENPDLILLEVSERYLSALEKPLH